MPTLLPPSRFKEWFATHHFYRASAACESDVCYIVLESARCFTCASHGFCTIYETVAFYQYLGSIKFSKPASTREKRLMRSYLSERRDL
jgi:hypothetical protein